MKILLKHVAVFHETIDVLKKYKKPEEEMQSISIINSDIQVDGGATGGNQNYLFHNLRTNDNFYLFNIKFKKVNVSIPVNWSLHINNRSIDFCSKVIYIQLYFWYYPL